MSADLDALAVELGRLDVLLAAEMQRMRARYELSLDEFHGLYITDQRVAALVRPAEPTVESTMGADISAARAADTVSRWHQLAAALQLDDDERDVMLLCLAPELDPKYDTVFAYLNDDVTRRHATADLAFRVFSRDEAHRLALRGLLLPSSKLISLGAIHLSAASRDETRCRRILRPAQPLADWLQGLPYVDERLSNVARFGHSESRVPSGAMPEALRGPLDGLVRRFSERSQRPPILLTAETATDAAAVAEELFARAARPALVVNLLALRSSSAPNETVAALHLAQDVLGVGIVATPLEALLDAEGRPVDLSLAAVRKLERSSAVVVFTADAQGRAHAVFGDGNAFEVQLPALIAQERAAMWHYVLGDVGSDAVVDALADRFALSIDRIRKAALMASEAAVLDGQDVPSPAHLFAAARTISAETSSGTTQTVTTPFEWEDLVLPLAVKSRLAEMIHAIERRPRVLDDWGFARSVRSMPRAAVIEAAMLRQARVGRVRRGVGHDRGYR